MAESELRALLHQHRHEIALVVGNGINRFGRSKGASDWDALLLELCREYLGEHESIPAGICQTEFYDLIALKADPSLLDKVSGNRVTSLQKRFCDLMGSWRPGRQHNSIVSWAMKNDCPILTTNFENTLSAAGHCQKHNATREHFSDYYPWSVYFSTKELTAPEAGFGIWHINGMSLYPRSVRLGLSHYMGSVHRARTWFHGSGGRRLFDPKNLDSWRGRQSWLHLLFSRNPIFLGLNLGVPEVFIRWLLIERARLFGRFPEQRRPAWYIYSKQDRKDPGKLFFLKGVGVTPVKVDSYDEIFGSSVWH